MTAFNTVIRLWLSAIILLACLLAACNGQTTYCSGTQYLSVTGSGRIASHSGAGLTNYQNNMRCYWQLSAPAGSIISALITFADFETSFDYVTLYDGTTSTSTAVLTTVSVTSSSGYVSPRFTSSSNTMLVYFYTDSNTVKRGFTLSYDVVNASTSSSSCGAISYTNSSNVSGVITSHIGYGSMSYSPNMTCLRTLPKRSGYTIAMSMTAFSLGTGDCVRLPISSITISSSTSTSGTMYCSDYLLTSTLSIDADDGAQIVFSSNSQSESSGFSIQFEYVQLQEGTFSSVINNVTEIVSHSGVGVTPYLNNMRYSWQFIVPTGLYVAARFSYIDLDGINDVIAVYNRVSDGSNLMTTLTGSSLPYSYASRVYTTSSNSMTIRFLTGSSGTALGFRLHVNTSKASGYVYMPGTGSPGSYAGSSTVGIASGVTVPIGAIATVGLIIWCCCSRRTRTRTRGPIVVTSTTVIIS